MNKNHIFQNLHPDMEHKCSICSSRVGLYKPFGTGRKNDRWGSGCVLPWVNIWMRSSKISLKVFDLTDFFCRFQELSLRPDNYVFDTLMCGEDNWTRHCRKILGAKGYIKMRSLRLLGMSINIFVKRKHFVHVRDLEWNYQRFDVKKSVSTYHEWFYGKISISHRMWKTKVQCTRCSISNFHFLRAHNSKTTYITDTILSQKFRETNFFT